MRRPHFIIAILSALCGLSVNATEIESTAGNLSTLISDPSTETTLTISGSVDASDFYFINEKMTSLTKLDLSKAAIVSYSGDAIYGSSNYNADEVPYGAFVGSNITDFVLPSSGNITISNGVFAGSSIKSITIGSNITLTEYAFMGCKNLTEVTLSQATAIPASAFEHCTALTAINGDALVTSIGDKAFNDCPELKSFTFGKDLTAIGNEAFQNSGLETIDLSDASSLTTIGDWSFAHCLALKSATIPETIKSIGIGAFFGDPALEIATLPATVTEIPDYAFTGDSALDLDKVWHEHITTIGQFALANMDNVMYITLPTGLTYIGDNAFEDMTGLVSISAITLTDVPQLGQTVWNGVTQSDVELRVMDNVAESFKAADQWKEFNISITTTTDKDIIKDNSNAVKAYFDDKTLHVISSNSDIVDVRVYDISSRQYAILTPQSTAVTIDTAAWNDNIYIVYVALADGSQSTIKLARK